MDHFFVVSSDGSTVAFMSQPQLDSLLEKMPTLRFLFFGHPQMEPKQLEERDGAKVVTIPTDLGVTKDALLAVITVVQGLRRLPTVGTIEYNRFVSTLTVLGGCEELNPQLEQLREMDAPSMPSEDRLQQYRWQMVQHYGNPVRIEELKILIDAQYDFSTTVKDERYNCVSYYRKPKGSTD